MDLPLCNSHNSIFTCIERLIKYCRLTFCFVGEGALSASSIAKLIIDNVLGFFGVPTEVISGGDPRFTASCY